MFDIYESKPKKVQAVQFTVKNKNQVFSALTGMYAQDMEGGYPVIKVTTIHGDTAIVRLGDWIVKEPIEGFYYPVAGGVFSKSYSLV